jgi:hypothetical protein
MRAVGVANDTDPIEVHAVPAAQPESHAPDELPVVDVAPLGGVGRVRPTVVPVASIPVRIDDDEATLTGQALQLPPHEPTDAVGVASRAVEDQHGRGIGWQVRWGIVQECPLDLPDEETRPFKAWLVGSVGGGPTIRCRHRRERGRPQDGGHEPRPGHPPGRRPPVLCTPFNHVLLPWSGSARAGEACWLPGSSRGFIYRRRRW